MHLNNILHFIFLIVLHLSEETYYIFVHRGKESTFYFCDHSPAKFLLTFFFSMIQLHKEVLGF